MFATGLTANGKYRELGTTYAGTKSKYWALLPTTGLFTRLLGFAPDSLAFHPTTGVAPEYWAFTRLLGFCPKTRFLLDWWAFPRILGSWDLLGTASDHRIRYQNDRNHENRRKWTQKARNGLRIRAFEAHSHFPSIANPPRPQKPTENSKNQHFGFFTYNGDFSGHSHMRESAR